MTGKHKEQGYGQVLADYWFRQYDDAHHAWRNDRGRLGLIPVARKL